MNKHARLDWMTFSRPLSAGLALIVNGEKVCADGDASYCSMDGYIAVVTVGGEQSEMTAGSTSMVGGYDLHLGSFGTAKDMLVCDGPLSEHYLFAVLAP